MPVTRQPTPSGPELPLYRVYPQPWLKLIFSEEGPVAAPVCIPKSPGCSCVAQQSTTVKAGRLLLGTSLFLTAASEGQGLQNSSSVDPEQPGKGARWLESAWSVQQEARLLPVTNSDLKFLGFYLFHIPTLIFICPLVYTSTNQPIHLSPYLSTHPPIYPSTHL